MAAKSAGQAGNPREPKTRPEAPISHEKGCRVQCPRFAGPVSGGGTKTRDTGRMAQANPSSRKLEAGQRVRVDQTIHARDGDWHTSVEGKVVRLAPRPTGSWYAHGKDDRLWLQRLRLVKEDGEIVEVNLDRDSVITIL